MRISSARSSTFRLWSEATYNKLKEKTKKDLGFLFFSILCGTFVQKKLFDRKNNKARQYDQTDVHCQLHGDPILARDIGQYRLCGRVERRDVKHIGFQFGIPEDHVRDTLIISATAAKARKSSVAGRNLRLAFPDRFFRIMNAIIASVTISP